MSRPEPYPLNEQHVAPTADLVLLDRFVAPFAVESRIGKAGDTLQFEQAETWFTPISGSGSIDGRPWRAGECWLIDGPAQVRLDTDMHALIARL